MPQTRPKPSFQPVDLDDIDQRLLEKAAQKGIPTLVAPPPAAAVPTVAMPAPRPQPATPAPVPPPTPAPRTRMKTVNVELPDYAWVELKIRAAREMVSVRHVLMTALKAHGIDINEADMIEDGRRLRS